MALANTMRDADARTLTKSTEMTFDGVVKRFSTGTTALDGIDLQVGRGDFVAVVGPSGCGKSTLLRMAAGLDVPTEGNVAVGTESVGFIFQEPTLLPWRTVRRNVELTAELGHLPKAERRERADAAIAAVGLGDFADQLPRALSGGMKMRASLARSLALAPDVLLLDEPFGALDEMTRLDMQVELQKLYAEKRFTAMFITHSVSEAVFLANRVVVMTARPGRIAEVIDVDFPYPRGPELRYDPRFTDHVSRISASLHGGAR
ncbi:putative ATP-binding protein BAB2_1147 [Rhodococcus sp. RD6.2]|jgi:NitT/TauT family transport system ATP-binding protein|uniref:ABC transporter ATP-binding protein n=1 Tax=unclassified Rhodococcus (in: high G+C Gram-positive bacteria) TaxID=192944 RepID=UPI00063B4239|nr:MULTISPECIES: ABC transporter ATP-binding protein [unclassified Rhodococcus (in: high G+C Gram-positive bacteria)]CRK51681.1 putative ATP-binding protein BAB2_1147 [Rhodococcus sp. RD6.2]